MSGADAGGGSPPRYGKYRGTVAANVDPEGKGRLLVEVPEVYGPGGSNWALPCLPFGGLGEGWFAVPPIRADVWVEFEKGDINQPIWTGCFYGVASPPGSLFTEKVLKTLTAELKLDDAGGIVTITTVSGAEITLMPGSVKIANGMGATIELIGPSVKLNGTALEVI